MSRLAQTVISRQRSKCSLWEGIAIVSEEGHIAISWLWSWRLITLASGGAARLAPIPAAATFATLPVHKDENLWTFADRD